MAPAASPSERERVGPHPSYIEVAKPYILQSRIQRCLADVHMSDAKEDAVRLQGVAWIDQVRRALQLPIRTFNTAVIYYHKFRLLHGDNEYNWADAAAAALFTACKIEDTLKKSKEILCAHWNLKVGPADGLSSDDPRFENHSKLIIGLERLMLESAGFDFRNRYPQKLMVKLARALKFDADNQAKTAWNLSIDLYRTFAPLKQTSPTLAIACLELAARLHAMDATRLVDAGEMRYSKWATSRAEVMETLLDLLDLYTHHRGSTAVGPLYTLEHFISIRIALNQEASAAKIPRYALYASEAAAGGESSTNGAKSRNGIDATSPLTPATPGTASPSMNQPPKSAIGVRGQDGTVRFMLDAARARDERAEVDKYHKVEEEEYEVEVPMDHHLDDREKERPRVGRASARCGNSGQTDGVTDSDYSSSVRVPVVKRGYWAEYRQRLGETLQHGHLDHGFEHDHPQVRHEIIKVEASEDAPRKVQTQHEFQREPSVESVRIRSPSPYQRQRMDAQQSVKVEGQSDGTVNHMPHRVLRLKSIKQPEDLDTALPEEEQYGYDGQPTAYYWQEDRRSGDNDSYGGVSQRLQSARFPSPPHVQYRLSRIPSKNTSRAYAPSQNERTPLCFPHREDHHSTRRPIPSTSKTRPKRLANFPAQDAVRDRPHFTSQQRQSIYMQTDNTNAKPRTSFADDFAPRPGHDKFPENRRLRREQRLITHEPRVATGTLVPQAGPSDQNGAAQISYSDTPTPTSYPGDPRRETKAGRRLIRREERLIVHEAKVKLGLAGPLLYPPKRTDPPQTGDSHAAESNGTVAGTKKLGKYTMKRLRQVELRAEKRAEKKARAAAEGHPGGGERACDDYDRGSEWQEGYGYADNSERRGGRDRARSGGQERARSPLTRAWSPAPRVRSPHHFARSSAPATPTLSAWRRAFGTRRDDSGRRW